MADLRLFARRASGLGGAAMIRFLLLFFFISTSLFAETMPAESGTYEPQILYWADSHGGPYTGPTPESVCNTGGVAYTGGGTLVEIIPRSSGYFWQRTCRMQKGTNVYDYHISAITQCRSGDAFNPYTGLCTGLTCPDTTWTLNNALCTRPDCPPGSEYDANGKCTKDCTSRQGQPTVNGSYAFIGAVSTWAVNGCQVYCPVRALAAGGGRGDECRFTGRPAVDSPDPEPLDRPDPDTDPPPEEPDDCLRRGQGYISGSNGISCVAPSDAPPANRPKIEDDKTEESGSPGSDGKPDPNSPDYKRNDSTAKNNGDGTITENGTETRKGTPDGDDYTCPDGYTKIGDGMCQKQWSKTQDENTFCQQNPKSPLCTGKLNDCEEGTDLARCVQLGKAPEGDTVQEKQIGVSSINPVSVATGGGCPAGISLPKGLGNFNWEPICTFASAMHPIVLVLAWLSAFFIIFGLKDN